MKIELKNIHFYEKMSDETNAFVADLYIDGKIVAYCKNEGCGGCTFIDPYPINDDYKTNQKMLEKARDFCKTLPHTKFMDESFEVFLSDYVDNLLTDYLKAKDKKKFEKKLANHLCWGVPNGNQYKSIKYSLPLLDIITKYPDGKTKIKNTVEKIKKELQTGEVIFNTELLKMLE